MDVKNIRDSANNSADISANGLWQQIATATGAKFDAYIGEGSPASMQAGLALMTSLAHQGILNAVEGGNEEDDPYPVANGNSLGITAQFQQQLYATAHALGLKVINMSFGQGWDKSPTGDYGTVGNLAAFADYANAHTYFGSGNPPAGAIAALNADAQLAASQPVITSEMGWYTNGNLQDPNAVSEAVQAKYMLDGLLDAYQAGDVKTYLYELLDQQNSGYSEYNFGLFRADGSAKPAAVALHNLTALLADSGSFTPGSMSYGLSGLQTTDHSLLMEKSDGSFWLALWNETLGVPAHSVTLTLASSAASITIYDPLNGTAPVQSASNASSLQLSLPDHPILVEIAAVQPAGIASGGTFIPPAAPQSNDLSIAAPSSIVVMPGQSIQPGGIVVNDLWALEHAGSMALNLNVSQGTLSMTDANGNPVTGSGSAAIRISGSLVEIDADLASLSYQAPAAAGADVVTVNIWNQAGVSTTQTIPVAIGGVTVTNADQAAVARLYTAALGRTPDPAGLAYWDNIYANNVSADSKAQGLVYALGAAPAGYNGAMSVAAGFSQSAEFLAKYGALDNDGFVRLLYQNALHRAAEPAGEQYWDTMLDSGAQTRAMVLVGFAESAENIKNSAAWLMMV